MSLCNGVNNIFFKNQNHSLTDHYFSNTRKRMNMIFGIMISLMLYKCNKKGIQFFFYFSEFINTFTAAVIPKKPWRRRGPGVLQKSESFSHSYKNPPMTQTTQNLWHALRHVFASLINERRVRASMPSRSSWWIFAAIRERF